MASTRHAALGVAAMIASLGAVLLLFVGMYHLVRMSIDEVAVVGASMVAVGAFIAAVVWVVRKS